MTRTWIAALGVLAAAGALPARCAGSARADDASLQTRLETAYELNSVLGEMKVDVRVKDAVAHLDCYVRSAPERTLASAIARDVDGIEHVDNAIHVRADFARNIERPPLAAAIIDDTIEAIVRSRLAWNRYTRGAPIEVESKYRIVTLKGKVPDAVARRWALRLARDTGDVKEAIGALEINSGARSAAPAADEHLAHLDSSIATRVRRNLEYSRAIGTGGIRVSAANGRVRLTGSLPRRDQVREARAQSAAVYGVEGIDDRHLEVLGEGGRIGAGPGADPRPSRR